MIVHYSGRERLLLALLQHESTITIEHVLKVIYPDGNAPVNARNVAVDLVRRLSRKLHINDDEVKLKQFDVDGQLHYQLERANLAA